MIFFVFFSFIRNYFTISNIKSKKIESEVFPVLFVPFIPTNPISHIMLLKFIFTLFITLKRKKNR